MCRRWKASLSNLKIHTVAWDPIAAEKGAYRHFMQKEIHEQVRSLTDTLAGRVNFEEGKIRLPQLNLTAEKAKNIQQDLYYGVWNGGACGHGG